jgi:circadian clock protein KaiB
MSRPSKLIGMNGDSHNCRHSFNAGGSMAKKSAKKRTGNSPRYKFSVYIASPTRKSDSALARLRKICDEKIPADYEIKVINLSKNPELATHHNIVATPAVFRTFPAPLRKSIGDLSKTDKALLGLDLFQL